MPQAHSAGNIAYDKREKPHRASWVSVKSVWLSDVAPAEVQRRVGLRVADLRTMQDYLGHRECARLGLEGIVAKRKDAPYRSDARSGWIKVKTAEWKAANQYRTKLFEKG